jgi:hypothetical protein
MLTLLAWILGLIASGWGFYKAAEGVRDLYYDTFPTVEIVGSDSSAPFALPFSVTNPSGWLQMRNVRWSTEDIEMNSWNKHVQKHQHCWQDGGDHKTP